MLEYKSAADVTLPRKRELEGGGEEEDEVVKPKAKKIKVRSFIQGLPDPDVFGRIRRIFTGFGSYRYFCSVTLFKQGKNN